MAGFTYWLYRTQPHEELSWRLRFLRFLIAAVMGLSALGVSYRIFDDGRIPASPISKYQYDGMESPRYWLALLGLGFIGVGCTSAAVFSLIRPGPGRG